MNLIAWLHDLGRATARRASGRPTASAGRSGPAPRPLTPWEAQQVRILGRAEQYRQHLRRQAEARAAQARVREREQARQAQREWEDAVARGLAREGVYLPSTARGTLPGTLDLAAWYRSGTSDYWTSQERNDR